jgi:hypothetical protein
VAALLTERNTANPDDELLRFVRRDAAHPHPGIVLLSLRVRNSPYGHHAGNWAEAEQPAVGTKASCVVGGR